MKIKIISIGKIKSKPVTELVSDYFSRLKHYHNASLNSSGTIYAPAISSSDYLVVMDEHGKN